MCPQAHLVKSVPGIEVFDKGNLQQLIQELRDSEVIDRIHIIGQEDSVIQDPVGAVIGGNVLIEGQSVAVQIILDKNFPESLPLIFIIPATALGFIPHVDQRGFVCYTQKEGLLLNRRDSIGIIKDALGMASEVLSQGVREKIDGIL